MTVESVMGGVAKRCIAIAEPEHHAKLESIVRSEIELSHLDTDRNGVLDGREFEKALRNHEF